MNLFYVGNTATVASKKEKFYCIRTIANKFMMRKFKMYLIAPLVKKYKKRPLLLKK